ncbi:MAG: GFA family protein [Burkholderiales bacterium]|nr:GFA family protein [Burkholderiales bacterium]
MSDTPTWTGGCLCGDIRYEADGEPLWVAHCHCATCRRHVASAVATFIGFDTARFRWLAPTGEYRSSPGVVRRHCARCGTPLSYESARGPDEVHILVGSLDHPERAVPSNHVWVAERLPWLHIDDGLPRYAGFGSGEQPVGFSDR